MVKTLVIIPSAGMGRRMGSKKKKNYLPLSGEPVLCHTLRAFEASSVDAIMIVAPKDDIDFCREKIVEKYGFRKVIGIVAGGAERQDSVGNGLEAAKGLGFDIIAVHDGARPLVPAGVIDATIRAAVTKGAAIAAVPVKDTIKEASKGSVKRTVPRDALWSVQTPQAFKAKVLYRAFKSAGKDGFMGTDESSLVERLGVKVSVVMGSYENIKITTAEDMLIAKAILASRKKAEKAAEA